jgi:hypothetical protein
VKVKRITTQMRNCHKPTQLTVSFPIYRLSSTDNKESVSQKE